MLRLGDAGLRRIASRMRAQRTCKGKQRHVSKGEAEAAMRSLIHRALHYPDAGPLNVYHCPRCFGWHVGHSHEKG
jgi:hypothetical protein